MLYLTSDPKTSFTQYLYGRCSRLFSLMYCIDPFYGSSTFSSLLRVSCSAIPDTCPSFRLCFLPCLSMQGCIFARLSLLPRKRMMTRLIDDEDSNLSVPVRSANCFLHAILSGYSRRLSGHNCSSSLSSSPSLLHSQTQHRMVSRSAARSAYSIRSRPQLLN